MWVNCKILSLKYIKKFQTRSCDSYGNSEHRSKFYKCQDFLQAYCLCVNVFNYKCVKSKNEFLSMLLYKRIVD